jgi:hypothetical protein
MGSKSERSETEVLALSFMYIVLLCSNRVILKYCRGFCGLYTETPTII